MIKLLKRGTPKSEWIFSFTLFQLSFMILFFTVMVHQASLIQSIAGKLDSVVMQLQLIQQPLHHRD